MKVIMITPYVTLSSRPELNRNQSGFGYMVYDIANAVGRIEKVDVLCTDSQGVRFEDDGVTYLSRSFLNYLKYIWCCLPIMTLFKFLRNYRMQKRSIMKLLYYWLMTGYLSHILEQEKYDIAHIHGCHFRVDLWIEVCKMHHLKYVVTLHGLNSFSDTVKLEPAGKQYERDFLQRVVRDEIPITVISTGMKKLIEKTYKVNECQSISVVCNSFSFKCGQKSIDIRSLYNIPKDARIILYIGNIGPRKNQGQLIRSFSLIPDNIAKNTYVLFLGSNQDDNYTIGGFAKATDYKDHFIECGAIYKEDVSEYYKQGDAVALMSLSEGFGLSLIEGMHYGLPCMSFTDIDAFEDIFDDNVMIGVDQHDDSSVAAGLVELLNRVWNKEYISNYSKKFEAHIMAESYVKVYESL